MLIRRQIGLTTIVVVVLAVASLAVMELGRRAAAAQVLGRQDAQQINHRAVALLASTHHFLLFPGQETAGEWRERLAAMADSVRHVRERWPGLALAPLAASLAGLEPLFTLLEQAELNPAPTPGASADLRARRRALLVERLVLETQSTADVAHRWSFDLDERMAAALRRWTALALALQLALVLAIGIAGWLLSGVFGKRLRRLHDAADALRSGRLEHRSGDRHGDEIGVVAQALDAAAEALQSQRRELITSNQRLEAEVEVRRIGERRLQLTLDAMPARVGYWSADGHNRIANRLLAQGAAVGGGTLHFDNRDGGVAADELAQLRRQVLAGETVVVERGVEGRRIQTILVAEQGPQGDVSGFLSHEMDVTDQRRLERRIADSEHFLTALTAAVPLQLGYVDADGVLRFANAAWCAAAAGRPDTLVGGSWAAGLPEARRLALAPQVEQALAGSPIRLEREERFGTGGGPRIVEYQFVPANVQHGGGMFWIGADVSERRRGEQLLSTIAALAPSGMLLVGRDGDIRFANAEAGRIFGYEVAELTGMPLLSLLPDEQRDAHRGLQQRFFENPVDRPLWVRSDLSGRRRNGRAVPLEIGLSAVETTTGTAALALVLDVSERRAQQRRLEAALAGRETLLREFYHRVKNNLQMVHSLLRMQWRLLPDEPARRALEDTARRVQAMALVHEQLREAHHGATHVSLTKYTAELLKLAGEAAGAAGRGIVLHAAVEPIDVTVERALPFGLLVNELVSNALQHAFESATGGRIDVELGMRDGVPCLRVADDGIGMPPGFEVDGVESMGLQLAVALAGQLGGALSFANANGDAERPGTVVSSGLGDLLRPLDAKPAAAADRA
ncbi:PAS domain-containing protein [Piscinibacter sakaiensis]|uniref:PAS domain-containing protein n=1 Tax=Piscinibacter sakaiensis TaxID=1547922 RepID=UPI003AAFA970